MNTDRIQRVGASCARVALAAILIGLSAGCGLVKTAYDHGETFAVIWAERYVDFDKSQESFAKPRLAAWFHWHRVTQLPDYAALATSLQGKVSGPLTQADLSTIEGQLRDRWHGMIDQAIPDLADLALALRPDQLNKMEQKFASNDETYRDEYVRGSAARHQREHFAKELERIEYWYGSLSSDQKATLRAMTDAQPIDSELWLSERIARERELVNLLRQIAQRKPSRDSVIASLRAFAARLETSPDPARQAYILALNKSYRDLFLEAANLATPEQRAHAVKKLQDWIADFRTLSKA